MSALIVNSVAHGTLTLSASGSFTYRPNTNFNGVDSFTYRTRDEVGPGNVATVTISITAVNDRPVAITDNTNTLEDTSVAIAVLANDLDVDSTPLTLAGAFTTNGTVTMSGTEVVFTPATNFNGNAVFTYVVSDGAAFSTGGVTVAVSPAFDLSVAVNDNTNALEDVPVTIRVLGNEYNPDKLSLSISSVFTTNGAAVVSGTNILFTADTNFNGTVVFSYLMFDGTGTSTATVTVVVAPVNDPPTGESDTYVTQQNVSLTIPSAGVLSNDTDIDSPQLFAVVVADVQHGSLLWDYDGSFTYTPASNYFGNDFFSYRVWDGLAFGPITTVMLQITLTQHLRFVSSGMASNGFRVDLAGPAPAIYTVHASTNSTAWFPISTNVTFDGVVSFIDTTVTGKVSRLYSATVGAQATTILQGNTVANNEVDVRLSRKASQSFRHDSVGASNYTISRVVLHLSRSATLPNANFLVSIGTGINAGAVPGSTVSISPASITNASSGFSFQTYHITYPVPIGPLLAGNTYYLNLECEASNMGRIYLESVDYSAYPNGTYYRSAVNQGEDLVFEIWGQ